MSALQQRFQIQHTPEERPCAEERLVQREGTEAFLYGPLLPGHVGPGTDCTWAETCKSSRQSNIHQEILCACWISHCRCVSLEDSVSTTVVNKMQNHQRDYARACAQPSDSATPRTVACQPPPSMGFSRQEHWSGLPFPSPGDLPDPGIEPASPVSPTLVGRFFTTGPQGKSQEPITKS